jgi:peptide deformylase
MIKRIDHVSLAVADREAATRFFVEALGARVVWAEAAPGQGFHWTTLELGESCLLEVIAPEGEQSFLHRFLARRGDGAHHITLHVDDIEQAHRHLTERGVPTFGLAEPYPGWKELYIHPRHAFGVLIQLAEFEPLDWVKPGDPVPEPYRGFELAARARATERVLRLGDPRLRQVCAPVGDATTPTVREAMDELRTVLAGVRAALGFGRAIAAPQIGLSSRLVAMDLGDGPVAMIDPVITARSDETFTLWDDCLSFPDLLVRVRRQASIDVRFRDLDGRTHEWRGLDRATSELVQHEVDHLDGVLAIDRAIDRESIVSRQVFEQMRERFDEMVDLANSA